MISSVVRGQGKADTIIRGDTIYIIDPPLILNRKYYIEPESPEKKRCEGRWFIEAGYGLGKNMVKGTGENYKTTYHTFFSPSVRAGWEWKQWSVSIGVSRLSGRGSATYSDKITDSVRSLRPVQYVVDVYYTPQGPVYVRRTRMVPVYNKETRDTSYTHSFKISYWLLPLHVQYRIKTGKWDISPGLGIAAAFASGDSLLISSNSNSHPKKMMLVASASLSVGRTINKHFSGEIYSECSRNIGTMTGAKGMDYFFLISGGFRLRYFFNQE